jgi:hypothetical protein
MPIVIETPLGRFRMVNPRDAMRGNREDAWLLECPGCGQWAYLDDDQWHGRVSVDHAADGCPGGYHETHDYSAALDAGMDAAALPVAEEDTPA